MYALIMAGGSGTRFWPKSRQHFPKQLISIPGLNEGSLIQVTVRRIRELVDLKNIYIVTNELYKNKLKKQLPEIAPENIIVEPVGRNTAPCIGLGVLHIKKRDPDGLIFVLSSDHFIRYENMYIETLKKAADFAKNNDSLMTIGALPTYPETGYGYICIGETLHKNDSIYKVEKFQEKPSYKKAQELFESKKYLWNCGTFIWKANVILEKIKKHLPDLYKSLMEIEKYIGTSDYDSKLSNIYSDISSVSIDYGILEKEHDDVQVIVDNSDWSDVGSWKSLYDVLPKDENKNVIYGQVITKDTKNSIIDSGKKIIAAIGVEDLVIINTDDALLICKKNRAQEVKEIVTALKKKGLDKFI